MLNKVSRSLLQIFISCLDSKSSNTLHNLVIMFVMDLVNWHFLFAVCAVGSPVYYEPITHRVPTAQYADITMCLITPYAIEQLLLLS